ncbi:MAG: adenine-specific methyltransferase EcoRI family protein, partial [Ruminococcus sp.]|nr:adenine-specific methyltransferase EcoRI family protein [Ruminococcus sp.]
FSLFREYVAQLMEYNKKFIIIGNQNAITYKEIFPLLKDNKMWLGYKVGDMAFKVPESYEEKATRFWIDEDGQKWRSLGNICWFTNLDIQKRHEDIILFRNYTPEDYPKYDNYNAINVNKVADIPCDYDGIMGVPITFFDKYNPEQFEIIDALNRYALLDSQNTNVIVKEKHSHMCNINGKPTYFRILIKKR